MRRPATSRAARALAPISGAVLESLYQHRVLSTRQLSVMHAPGPDRRWMQRVMAALVDARLVDFVRVGRGAPRLYHLTAAGADAVELIATRTEPRRRLITAARAAGPLHAHTREVNDVGDRVHDRRSRPRRRLWPAGVAPRDRAPGRAVTRPAWRAGRDRRRRPHLPAASPPTAGWPSTTPSSSSTAPPSPSTRSPPNSPATPPSTRTPRRASTSRHGASTTPSSRWSCACSPAPPARTH